MSIPFVVKQPNLALLADVFVPGEQKTYLNTLLNLFSELDKIGFSLVVLRVAGSGCQRQTPSPAASSPRIREAAESVDPIALCAAGIGRTSQLSFGILYRCTLCGRSFFDRPPGILAKQINSLDSLSGGRMRIVMSAEFCDTAKKNVFLEFVQFLSGKATILTENGNVEFELKPKYTHEGGFLPLGILVDTDSPCAVLGDAFVERLAFRITKSDIAEKSKTQEFPSSLRKSQIFFEEYLLCDADKAFPLGNDKTFKQSVNLMFNFCQTPPEKILDAIGAGKDLLI